MSAFRVQQIDHVELFVPDRYEAARWYEKVLGLTILGSTEKRAAAPFEPVMISSDGGNTRLALFERSEVRGCDGGGFDQVAFRVDGQGFVMFVDRLPRIALYNKKNERLSLANVRDHGDCYSMHFCDPWGYRLEVTTYERDFVEANLAGTPGDK